MYKCECGREFENAQSYNGHKSHCKIHALLKGKTIEQVDLEAKNRGKNSSNTCKMKTANAIKLSNYKWLSEKHTCEKCGKVMTEKFGSGRFCSRACANTRKLSAFTKHKISDKLKVVASGTAADNKQKAIENREIYKLSPKFCVICGKELPYERRSKKTCSEACKHMLLKNNTIAAIKLHGGNLNPTRNAKYGTYKGIECDSSYELAYVIYCLDHNISVKRNRQCFNYSYNGEYHNYYPDFIIDDTYVEIKNYWTEQVQAKIDCFPKHLKYQIIYKNGIKKYLTYCKKVYGSNFTELYDRDKPSYLNKMGPGTA